MPAYLRDIGRIYSQTNACGDLPRTSNRTNVCLPVGCTYYSIGDGDFLPLPGSSVLSNCLSTGPDSLTTLNLAATPVTYRWSSRTLVWDTLCDLTSGSTLYPRRATVSGWTSTVLTAAHWLQRRGGSGYSMNNCSVDAFASQMSVYKLLSYMSSESTFSFVPGTCSGAFSQLRLLIYGTTVLRPTRHLEPSDLRGANLRGLGNTWFLLCDARRVTAEVKLDRSCRQTCHAGSSPRNVLGSANWCPLTRWDDPALPRLLWKGSGDTAHIMQRSIPGCARTSRPVCLGRRCGGKTGPSTIIRVCLPRTISSNISSPRSASSHALDTQLVSGLGARVRLPLRRSGAGGSTVLDLAAVRTYAVVMRWAQWQTYS
ncbi:hypothetical protein DAEQUDRAFT_451055 [Daedalea quercina L-15889]|uniref:Uncharacterized protein n=1 Tax=Daedalea quercina L-15889 TaxID=1314783 RepID=A0A165N3W7_9APHY|nr:hypothetical protein DAEQUDRAFT_451055 [Daedalea quercina L-15889]